MIVFDPLLMVAVPANRWVGEWIRRGSNRGYRQTLADQLRIIRKRHGTTHAREWVKYIDWLGSYPFK